MRSRAGSSRSTMRKASSSIACSRSPTCSTRPRRTHQRRLVQDYLGDVAPAEVPGEQALDVRATSSRRRSADAYLLCVQAVPERRERRRGDQETLPGHRRARAARARPAGEMDDAALRPFRAAGSGARSASSTAMPKQSGFARLRSRSIPAPTAPARSSQEYLKVMMLWASQRRRAAAAEAGDRRAHRRALSRPLSASATRLSRARSIVSIPRATSRPMRLFADVRGRRRTLTFFGPGDAPQKLARDRSQRREDRRAASGLEPRRRPIRRRSCSRVLKHLALYWSDKPPARASERRADHRAHHHRSGILRARRRARARRDRRAQFQREQRRELDRRERERQRLWRTRSRVDDRLDTGGRDDRRAGRRHAAVGRRHRAPRHARRAAAVSRRHRDHLAQRDHGAHFVSRRRGASRKTPCCSSGAPDRKRRSRARACGAGPLRPERCRSRVTAAPSAYPLRAFAHDAMRATISTGHAYKVARAGRSRLPILRFTT